MVMARIIRIILSRIMSVVEVIIEKNRSGPRGTVKLLFAKSYNKFASVSYIPEDNN